MSKKKYPISNEFFPFNKFAPPMHGFDTAFNTPASQTMIAKRIAYMKRMYYR